MSLQPSTRRFPARHVSSLAALAAVREAFVEWLAGITSSDERIEDLSVVISELGANAVRGTPEGSDPPTVSAWLDDGRVVLEVANRVEDLAVPDVDWDLGDPLRTGGRGLLLVSAFVDDVHVDVEGDVLIIRCTTQV
jgi:anti-sigma regulatory factor (Ser/Thr protein kinase)